MPLHGPVLPEYDVVHPSVHLPGVKMINCDHISWATWNFVTELISPVSQLFACKTSAI